MTQIPPGGSSPQPPTAPESTPAATARQLLEALADTDRLTAVGALDLEHPALRGRLGEISARTSAVLGMPIALVTVVLESAQVVIGCSGLDGWIAAAGGTPVEWSFCAHAVATGGPYVVPDAGADPVQSHNPLVTVDGIASYAGVPLVSPSGHLLGTHCVIGSRPHAFTAAELELLAEAAAEVTSVLAEFTR
jgi:GAF domain-containing protein